MQVVRNRVGHSGKRNKVSYRGKAMHFNWRDFLELVKPRARLVRILNERFEPSCGAV
jgi:hypothetical protein